MLNNQGQSKASHKEEENTLENNSSNEWLKLKNNLSEVDKKVFCKERAILLCADSRVALSKFPENSVSCIITSPPYGDLKNYGSDNQIGFGQNWENEYLPDLEMIFSELYKISKSGGAMWIVLDMIKEGGEMIPLPWEVITRAKSAGWTFHDLVIWDKGKSLPWSNKGKFRGVCEYILLLGKGKLNNFKLDAVRDSENLSSYWVKYPERYHPDGKAPSDLWHFPIPTQGSWSKKQSRHYCPFPIRLIARMIAISTNPGDLICDPFAGTGSVTAVASYLNRLGIGIEINRDFVDEFEEFGFDAITENAQIELPNKNATNNSLRETIIKLRMNKYPKALFSGLSRADQLGTKAREYIEKFFIKSSSISQTEKNKSLNSSNLGKIELQILLKDKADINLVKDSINKRIKVAPLSIFGIKAVIEVIPFKEWSDNTYTSSLKEKNWYLYKNGNFHNFAKDFKNNNLKQELEDQNLSKMPSIISSIKLAVESPVKV